MRSRRWLVIIGCLAMAFALAAFAAGCGGEADSGGGDGGGDDRTGEASARSILECPQGPQSDETPQYGGDLVLIHYAAPTNLGAFWMQTGFTDVQMSRYAVENLVGLNAEGQPVPQLATSWDLDEAGMTVTFYLREGVKFHDGTDFNAEAVKWNFDQWQTSEKKDLAAVTSVDVIDSYSVKVSFSEWDPLWVQGLNSGGAGKMVSPTAVQAAEKEIDFKRKPVGTGPFKVVENNPTKVVRFERFDDYWQEGLPYLDSVEIRMVNDTMAGLMAFKGGEADALYFNGGTTAEELIAAGDKINSRIFSMWSIGGDSLSEDCPWSDQKVREAVAYALDVDAIVKGVYGDFMYPTTQLAIEGKQAYNPDIVGHPYNVEKAKELLAESEFNISKDNPWNVKFTYIVQAGDESKVMTVLQEYLAEVGINLQLNGASFPAQKDLAEKGFAGQLILTDLSYNGVEMQYSTSLTANFSEDAVAFGNHMFIPEEFTTLYRQMKQETDLAKREVMYQELNKIAIDDYCLVVPFMGNEGFVAVAPYVHDYDFGNGTVGEFLPERAWMSK